MAFWVFLVGGRGTRLSSLTTDTPKPLLPVGGRPFLDYLLDRAVCFGASEILLLAGHLAEKVVASYHNRPWNGVPVRCHVEAEPMGTAGALRQASARLPARWVLMNGDTLFDVDPARLDQPGDDWQVSMALRRLDDTGRSGTVTLKDGRVGEFHERGTGGPGLVNAGVYVMRREILDVIPPDRPCSLEAEIFPALAKSGRIRGTVLDGYFIDIGVPEDYFRAQREVPGRALPSVKRAPL